MENLPIYHGPIGKEEGERRLGQDGRDGCYLIRNSDSLAGVYCLCVLCKGFVYTYRLYQDDTGSWAAETTPGVPKRCFRQIKNLIRAFQKAEQGIAMPLLYPITAQGRADTQSLGSLSPPPAGHRSSIQQQMPNAVQKNRNQKEVRQTYG
ncbi:SH2 domain-containing protein 1A [Oryzias melastigma]|uniref:SH2 domain-containing protein 1A n=1 Tax=Oryzias melastigma TaxID=30732 RepID=A0A834EVP2_ORYME|nr:SH2 domain-containing protein 1A [Oryzias melastigma]